MAQNDFLAFATGAGADVITQAEYEALLALSQGFTTGTAISGQLNKVWRQSSFMAAVIATFFAQQTGADVIDDGSVDSKIALLRESLQRLQAEEPVYTDSGTINTVSILPGLGITALADGTTLAFAPKYSNNNEATLNVNGIGPAAIIGPTGTLQGGEIVAGGVCRVEYSSAAAAWRLLSCTSGATQVANASQSGHALNLGQALTTFAPAAGNPAQGFSVKTAASGSQAVTLSQAQNLAYPVGAVFIDTIGTRNPAAILGFGTWAEIGQGRVLVGLDATQSQFNTMGGTGGENTHVLTASEIPDLTPPNSAVATDYRMMGKSIPGQGTTGDGFDATGSGSEPNVNDTAFTGTTGKLLGGGQAHNNLQPYLVVRMWKRTA